MTPEKPNPAVDLAPFGRWTLLDKAAQRRRIQTLTDMRPFGMSSPQVGVGVLIVQNGRVLLGKRKGAHGAGTWSAPGGHLEFGESIDACARREVLEETGLEIHDLQYGPFTNNVFENDKKHYVTVFVLAKSANGEAQVLEPDKCEGWAWFEALPEPLFPPLETLRSQGYVPTWTAA